MTPDNNLKETGLLRVDSARFGPFTFQIGVARPELESLVLRVGDAQARFRVSPWSQVANRLEKEVVVSSIFGTNSIEGGTLSEQETEQALALEPTKVRDIEQRRALNLKAAYDFARVAVVAKDWRLDLGFICRVHAIITDQLPHPYNRPGIVRDNPEGIVTFVGDAAHGGRYKPPQYGHDIRQLLEALVLWHQALQEQNIPVLIRAPLVHLYFELTHPFWDGNGRVGRVLEAILLQREGFHYAPFAQARYYFDHIDEYFTLFNVCRKQAEKKVAFPNTPFVQFFLQGMLAGINKLHDRVNSLITLLVFESNVKRAHDERKINARQYAILSFLLSAGTPIRLAELRKTPWYNAMYTRRTDKTRQRDLSRLREMELVIVDKHNRVWPGCYTVPEEDE
ncbi:MAG: Fic family protein [Gammaproteobacteria bacterium]|nr:Fic family protein [Gammaproteobacteria bacterium]